MKLRLLDDQPVDTSQDRLHFDRYLNAIESHILDRNETTPFAVGIFGRWGTGKSTLMRMLAQRLAKEPQKYEIVEFSPWIYSTEKSLLLPLLATISKKRLVFEKLIKEIVKSGPSFIGMLSSMTIDAATTGLPLLTFLKSIQTNKEKAKELTEKIRDAVVDATGGERRMVFLIDDIDRCQDPAQIIGLFEQIKLFLHIDRCIFFICADKEQLLKAINTKFPGEGDTYLDKFVQLPIELHPHHSHHLVDILGIEAPEKRRFMLRIAEVLDNNPRKFKKLWNRAVTALSILKEELQRVRRNHHEPSLELMLKWQLLKDCGSLCSNPYLYLKLENSINQSSAEELLIKLGMKKQTGTDISCTCEWTSEFHRKLSVFILGDLHRNKFGSPEIIGLYALASGEDVSRSVLYLEEMRFSGNTQIESMSFNLADLSEGLLSGLEFIDCDFSYSDLKGADLEKTKFIRCDLNEACFDGVQTGEGMMFENCTHVHHLNTEPGTYETIADLIVTCWRECDKTIIVKGIDNTELYKMYKTIIRLHEANNTLTDEITSRLLEKGFKIRNEIMGLNNPL